jgi:hypothetical protein
MAEGSEVENSDFGGHAAEPTAADQDQSGKRTCVCRLDFTCLICRVTGQVRPVWPKHRFALD